MIQQTLAQMAIIICKEDWDMIKEFSLYAY